jgi:DNA-binding NarL/FixJ family response regulator
MGLAYALKAQGFEVMGEASNGLEVIEVCRSSTVDVVLLDVKMPVMNGIEACKAIQELEPAPLAVMLTTFDEPAIIHASQEAGAIAYLTKETPPAKLAQLLRKIMEEPDRGWMPRVEVPALTGREAQVLALLAEGCSNKEMAKRLEISPQTVKDYLNGVYRKLEVRDRVSALRRAQQLGLLP